MIHHPLLDHIFQKHQKTLTSLDPDVFSYLHPHHILGYLALVLKTFSSQISKYGMMDVHASNLECLVVVGQSLAEEGGRDFLTQRRPSHIHINPVKIF